MKFLSAPWRWDFITSMVKKKNGCVFCEAVKLPEGESLICHRGKDFFVILNKYPYNAAHLMVVPYKHLDSPEKVSPEQSVEMWELTNRTLAIVREQYHPSGFNLGMNLGIASGAGVKGHFHMHIVPRWPGDANFMPIIGETRVLSYSMDDQLETLRNAFKQ
ncbi:MAG: HIT domain-containing protein [bacterium]|nr:HIT domain-containing protein [bacterium]